MFEFLYKFTGVQGHTPGKQSGWVTGKFYLKKIYTPTLLAAAGTMPIESAERRESVQEKSEK
jgi:hypothetical protein